MKTLLNQEDFTAVNQDIDQCFAMWREGRLDPLLVAYGGLFRFSTLAMEFVDPKDLDLFLATAIEMAKRYDKQKGEVEYDG